MQLNNVYEEIMHQSHGEHSFQRKRSENMHLKKEWQGLEQSLLNPVSNDLRESQLNVGLTADRMTDAAMPVTDT